MNRFILHKWLLILLVLSSLHCSWGRATDLKKLSKNAVLHEKSKITLLSHHSKNNLEERLRKLLGLQTNKIEKDRESIPGEYTLSPWSQLRYHDISSGVRSKGEDIAIGFRRGEVTKATVVNVNLGIYLEKGALQKDKDLYLTLNVILDRNHSKTARGVTGHLPTSREYSRTSNQFFSTANLNSEKSKFAYSKSSYEVGEEDFWGLKTSRQNDYSKYTFFKYPKPYYSSMSMSYSMKEHEREKEQEESKEDGEINPNHVVDVVQIPPTLESFTDIKEEDSGVENNSIVLSVTPIEKDDEEVGYIDEETISPDGEAGSLGEEAGHINEESGSLDEEAGGLGEEAGHIDDEAGGLGEEAGYIDEEAGSLDEEAGELDEEDRTKDKGSSQSETFKLGLEKVKEGGTFDINFEKGKKGLDEDFDDDGFFEFNLEKGDPDDGGVFELGFNKGHPEEEPKPEPEPEPDYDQQVEGGFEFGLQKENDAGKFNLNVQKGYVDNYENEKKTEPEECIDEYENGGQTGEGGSFKLNLQKKKWGGVFEVGFEKNFGDGEQTQKRPCVKGNKTPSPGGKDEAVPPNELPSGEGNENNGLQDEVPTGQEGENEFPPVTGEEGGNPPQYDDEGNENNGVPLEEKPNEVPPTYGEKGPSENGEEGNENQPNVVTPMNGEEGISEFPTGFPSEYGEEGVSKFPPEFPSDYGEAGASEFPSEYGEEGNGNQPNEVTPTGGEAGVSEFPTEYGEEGNGNQPNEVTPTGGEAGVSEFPTEYGEEGNGNQPNEVTPTGGEAGASEFPTEHGEEGTGNQPNEVTPTGGEAGASEFPSEYGEEGNGNQPNEVTPTVGEAGASEFPTEYGEEGNGNQPNEVTPTGGEAGTSEFPTEYGEEGNGNQSNEVTPTGGEAGASEFPTEYGEDGNGNQPNEVTPMGGEAGASEFPSEYGEKGNGNQPNKVTPTGGEAGASEFPTEYGEEGNGNQPNEVTPTGGEAGASEFPTEYGEEGNGNQPNEVTPTGGEAGASEFPSEYGEEGNGNQPNEVTPTGGEEGLSSTSQSEENQTSQGPPSTPIIVSEISTTMTNEAHTTGFEVDWSSTEPSQKPTTTAQSFAFTTESTNIPQIIPHETSSSGSFSQANDQLDQSTWRTVSSPFIKSKGTQNGLTPESVATESSRIPGFGSLTTGFGLSQERTTEIPRGASETGLEMSSSPYTHWVKFRTSPATTNPTETSTEPNEKLPSSQNPYKGVESREPIISGRNHWQSNSASRTISGPWSPEISVRSRHSDFTLRSTQPSKVASESSKVTFSENEPSVNPQDRPGSSTLSMVPTFSSWEQRPQNSPKTYLKEYSGYKTQPKSMSAQSWGKYHSANLVEQSTMSMNPTISSGEEHSEYWPSGEYSGSSTATKSYSVSAWEKNPEHSPSTNPVEQSTISMNPTITSAEEHPKYSPIPQYPGSGTLAKSHSGSYSGKYPEHSPSVTPEQMSGHSTFSMSPTISGEEHAGNLPSTYPGEYSGSITATKGHSFGLGEKNSEHSLSANPEHQSGHSTISKSPTILSGEGHPQYSPSAHSGGSTTTTKGSEENNQGHSPSTNPQEQSGHSTVPKHSTITSGEGYPEYSPSFHSGMYSGSSNLAKSHSVGTGEKNPEHSRSENPEELSEHSTKSKYPTTNSGNRYPEYSPSGQSGVSITTTKGYSVGSGENNQGHSPSTNPQEQSGHSTVPKHSTVTSREGYPEYSPSFHSGMFSGSSNLAKSHSVGTWEKNPVYSRSKNPDKLSGRSTNSKYPTTNSGERYPEYSPSGQSGRNSGSGSNNPEKPSGHSTISKHPTVTSGEEYVKSSPNVHSGKTSGFSIPARSRTAGSSDKNPDYSQSVNPKEESGHSTMSKHPTITSGAGHPKDSPSTHSRRSLGFITPARSHTGGSWEKNPDHLQSVYPKEQSRLSTPSKIPTITSWEKHPQYSPSTHPGEYAGSSSRPTSHFRSSWVKNSDHSRSINPGELSGRSALSKIATISSFDKHPKYLLSAHPGQYTGLSSSSKSHSAGSFEKTREHSRSVEEQPVQSNKVTISTASSGDENPNHSPKAHSGGYSRSGTLIKRHSASHLQKNPEHSGSIHPEKQSGHRSFKTSVSSWERHPEYSPSSHRKEYPPGGSMTGSPSPGLGGSGKPAKPKMSYHKLWMEYTKQSTGTSIENAASSAFFHFYPRFHASAISGGAHGNYFTSTKLNSFGLHSKVGSNLFGPFATSKTKKMSESPKTKVSRHPGFIASYHHHRSSRTYSSPSSHASNMMLHSNAPSVPSDFGGTMRFSSLSQRQRSKVSKERTSTRKSPKSPHLAGSTLRSKLTSPGEVPSRSSGNEGNSGSFLPGFKRSSVGFVQIIGNTKLFMAISSPSVGSNDHQVSVPDKSKNPERSKSSSISDIHESIRRTILSSMDSEVQFSRSEQQSGGSGATATGGAIPTILTQYRGESPSNVSFTPHIVQVSQTSPTHLPLEVTAGGSQNMVSLSTLTPSLDLSKISESVQNKITRSQYWGSELPTSLKKISVEVSNKEGSTKVSDDENTRIYISKENKSSRQKGTNFSSEAISRSFTKKPPIALPAKTNVFSKHSNSEKEKNSKSVLSPSDVPSNKPPGTSSEISKLKSGRPPVSLLQKETTVGASTYASSQSASHLYSKIEEGSFPIKISGSSSIKSSKSFQPETVKVEGSSHSITVTNLVTSYKPRTEKSPFVTTTKKAVSSSGSEASHVASGKTKASFPLFSKHASKMRPNTAKPLPATGATLGRRSVESQRTSSSTKTLEERYRSSYPDKITTRITKKLTQLSSPNYSNKHSKGKPESHRGKSSLRNKSTLSAPGTEVSLKTFWSMGNPVTTSYPKLISYMVLRSSLTHLSRYPELSNTQLESKSADSSPSSNGRHSFRSQKMSPLRISGLTEFPLSQTFANSSFSQFLKSHQSYLSGISKNSRSGRFTPKKSSKVTSFLPSFRLSKNYSPTRISDFSNGSVSNGLLPPDTTSGSENIDTSSAPKLIPTKSFKLFESSSSYYRNKIESSKSLTRPVSSPGGSEQTKQRAPTPKNVLSSTEEYSAIEMTFEVPKKGTKVSNATKLPDEPGGRSSSHHTSENTQMTSNATRGRYSKKTWEPSYSTIYTQQSSFGFGNMLSPNEKDEGLLLVSRDDYLDSLSSLSKLKESTKIGNKGTTSQINTHSHEISKSEGSKPFKQGSSQFSNSIHFEKTNPAIYQFSSYPTSEIMKLTTKHSDTVRSTTIFSPVESSESGMEGNTETTTNKRTTIVNINGTSSSWSISGQNTQSKFGILNSKLASRLSPAGKAASTITNSAYMASTKATVTSESSSGISGRSHKEIQASRSNHISPNRTEPESTSLSKYSTSGIKRTSATLSTPSKKSESGIEYKSESTTTRQATTGRASIGYGSSAPPSAGRPYRPHSFRTFLTERTSLLSNRKQSKPSLSNLPQMGFFTSMASVGYPFGTSGKSYEPFVSNASNDATTQTSPSVFGSTTKIEPESSPFTNYHVSGTIYSKIGTSGHSDTTLTKRSSTEKPQTRYGGPPSVRAPVSYRSHSLRTHTSQQASRLPTSKQIESTLKSNLLLPSFSGETSRPRASSTSTYKKTVRYVTNPHSSKIRKKTNGYWNMYSTNRSLTPKPGTGSFENLNVSRPPAIKYSSPGREYPRTSQYLNLMPSLEQSESSLSIHTKKDSSVGPTIFKMASQKGGTKSLQLMKSVPLSGSLTSLSHVPRSPFFPVTLSGSTGSASTKHTIFSVGRTTKFRTRSRTRPTVTKEPSRQSYYLDSKSSEVSFLSEYATLPSNSTSTTKEVQNRSVSESKTLLSSSLISSKQYTSSLHTVLPRSRGGLSYPSKGPVEMFNSTSYNSKWSFSSGSGSLTKVSSSLLTTWKSSLSRSSATNDITRHVSSNMESSMTMGRKTGSGYVSDNKLAQPASFSKVSLQSPFKQSKLESKIFRSKTSYSTDSGYKASSGTVPTTSVNLSQVSDQVSSLPKHSASKSIANLSAKSESAVTNSFIGAPSGFRSSSISFTGTGSPGSQVFQSESNSFLESSKNGIIGSLTAPKSSGAISNLSLKTTTPRFASKTQFSELSGSKKSELLITGILPESKIPSSAILLQSSPFISQVYQLTLYLKSYKSESASVTRRTQPTVSGRLPRHTEPNKTAYKTKYSHITRKPSSISYFDEESPKSLSSETSSITASFVSEASEYTSKPSRFSPSLTSIGRTKSRFSLPHKMHTHTRAVPFSQYASSSSVPPYSNYQQQENSNTNLQRSGTGLNDRLPRTILGSSSASFSKTRSGKKPFSAQLLSKHQTSEAVPFNTQPLSTISRKYVSTTYKRSKSGLMPPKAHTVTFVVKSDRTATVKTLGIKPSISYTTSWAMEPSRAASITISSAATNKIFSRPDTSISIRITSVSISSQSISTPIEMSLEGTTTLSSLKESTLSETSFEAFTTAPMTTVLKATVSSITMTRTVSVSPRTSVSISSQLVSLPETTPEALTTAAITTFSATTAVTNSITMAHTSSPAATSLTPITEPTSTVQLTTAMGTTTSLTQTATKSETFTSTSSTITTTASSAPTNPLMTSAPSTYPSTASQIGSGISTALGMTIGMTGLSESQTSVRSPTVRTKSTALPPSSQLMYHSPSTQSVSVTAREIYMGSNTPFTVSTTQLANGTLPSHFAQRSTPQFSQPLPKSTSFPNSQLAMSSIFSRRLPSVLVTQTRSASTHTTSMSAILRYTSRLGKYSQILTFFAGTDRSVGISSAKMETRYGTSKETYPQPPSSLGRSVRNTTSPRNSVPRTMLPNATQMTSRKSSGKEHTSIHSSEIGTFRKGSQNLGSRPWLPITRSNSIFDMSNQVVMSNKNIYSQSIRTNVMSGFPLPNKGIGTRTRGTPLLSETQPNLLISSPKIGTLRTSSQNLASKQWLSVSRSKPFSHINGDISRPQNLISNKSPYSEKVTPFRGTNIMSTGLLTNKGTGFRTKTTSLLLGTQKLFNGTLEPLKSHSSAPSVPFSTAKTILETYSESLSPQRTSSKMKTTSVATTYEGTTAMVVLAESSQALTKSEALTTAAMTTKSVSSPVAKSTPFTQSESKPVSTEEPTTSNAFTTAPATTPVVTTEMSSSSQILSISPNTTVKGTTDVATSLSSTSASTIENLTTSESTTTVMVTRPPPTTLKATSMSPTQSASASQAESSTAATSSAARTIGLRTTAMATTITSIPSSTKSEPASTLTPSTSGVPSSKTITTLSTMTPLVSRSSSTASSTAFEGKSSPISSTSAPVSTVQGTTQTSSYTSAVSSSVTLSERLSITPTYTKITNLKSSSYLAVSLSARTQQISQSRTSGKSAQTASNTYSVIYTPSSGKSPTVSSEWAPSAIRPSPFTRTFSTSWYEKSKVSVNSGTGSYVKQFSASPMKFRKTNHGQSLMTGSKNIKFMSRSSTILSTARLSRLFKPQSSPGSQPSGSKSSQPFTKTSPATSFLSKLRPLLIYTNSHSPEFGSGSVLQRMFYTKPFISGTIRGGISGGTSGMPRSYLLFTGLPQKLTRTDSKNTLTSGQRTFVTGSRNLVKTIPYRGSINFNSAFVQTKTETSVTLFQAEISSYTGPIKLIQTVSVKKQTQLQTSVVTLYNPSLASDASGFNQLTVSQNLFRSTLLGSSLVILHYNLYSPVPLSSVSKKTLKEQSLSKLTSQPSWSTSNFIVSKEVTSPPMTSITRGTSKQSATSKQAQNSEARLSSETFTGRTSSQGTDAKKTIVSFNWSLTVLPTKSAYLSSIPPTTNLVTDTSATPSPTTALTNTMSTIPPSTPLQTTIVITTAFMTTIPPPNPLIKTIASKTPLATTIPPTPLKSTIPPTTHMTTTIPPTILSTTPMVTTIPATTAVATTILPTTLIATTIPPTTAMATTIQTTTPLQTTIPPTTAIATTILASTPLQTTIPPTTALVTTIPPTTPLQTTIPPTTALATTIPPTTSLQTTLPPTTVLATSIPPTTPLETTIPPTTALATTTIPPTTPLQTTVLPTTPLQTTIPPTTALQTTVLPTTPLQTTVLPTTPLQTTIPPTTALATTIPPTTPMQTTIPPTTPLQSTVPPTTPLQTTVPLTTPLQSIVPPTTPLQTTIPPTTPLQSTAPPTTPLQTTVPLTTPFQSTVPPTTPLQTTVPLTTPLQTTVPPTTPLQTTIPPTTPLQSTAPPTTPLQTTVPLTTPLQSTVPPTTPLQTTVALTTPLQTTSPPTTPMQTTVPPTTALPTTIPSTARSVTRIPPTTLSETTVPPSTSSATSIPPTTPFSLTIPPTTFSVTNVAPTTLSATAVPPSTSSATSVPPSAPLSSTVPPATASTSSISPTTSLLTSIPSSTVSTIRSSPTTSRTSIPKTSVVVSSPLSRLSAGTQAKSSAALTSSILSSTSVPKTTVLGTIGNSTSLPGSILQSSSALSTTRKTTNAVSNTSLSSTMYLLSGSKLGSGSSSLTYSLKPFSNSGTVNYPSKTGGKTGQTGRSASFSFSETSQDNLLQFEVEIETAQPKGKSRAGIPPSTASSSGKTNTVASLITSNNTGDNPRDDLFHSKTTSKPVIYQTESKSSTLSGNIIFERLSEERSTTGVTESTKSRKISSKYYGPEITSTPRSAHTTTFKYVLSTTKISFQNYEKTYYSKSQSVNVQYNQEVKTPSTYYSQPSESAENITKHVSSEGSNQRATSQYSKPSMTVHISESSLSGLLISSTTTKSGKTKSFITVSLETPVTASFLKSSSKEALSKISAAPQKTKSISEETAAPRSASPSMKLLKSANTLKVPVRSHSIVSLSEWVQPANSSAASKLLKSSGTNLKFSLQSNSAARSASIKVSSSEIVSSSASTLFFRTGNNSSPEVESLDRPSFSVTKKMTVTNSSETVQREKMSIMSETSSDTTFNVPPMRHSVPRSASNTALSVTKRTPLTDKGNNTFSQFKNQPPKTGSNKLGNASKTSPKSSYPKATASFSKPHSFEPNYSPYKLLIAEVELETPSANAEFKTFLKPSNSNKATLSNAKKLSMPSSSSEVSSSIKHNLYDKMTQNFSTPSKFNMVTLRMTQTQPLSPSSAKTTSSTVPNLSMSTISNKAPPSIVPNFSKPSFSNNATSVTPSSPLPSSSKKSSSRRTMSIPPSSSKVTSSIAPNLSKPSFSSKVTSRTPSSPLPSSSKKSSSRGTMSIPPSSSKATSSIAPNLSKPSFSSKVTSMTPSSPLPSSSKKSFSRGTMSIPPSSSKATSSIAPNLSKPSFSSKATSRTPSLPLPSSSKKSSSRRTMSIPPSSSKATSSISPMAMLDQEIALFVSKNISNISMSLHSSSNQDTSSVAQHLSGPSISNTVTSSTAPKLSMTFNKTTLSIESNLSMPLSSKKKASSTVPNSLPSSFSKLMLRKPSSMHSASSTVTSSIPPMAMLDHEIALFVSKSDGNFAMSITSPSSMPQKMSTASNSNKVTSSIAPKTSTASNSNRAISSTAPTTPFSSSSNKASSSMAPKMSTASNSSIAPTVPLSSSSVQAIFPTISLPSSSNKAKSSIVPKMPTASNLNNAPTLPLSSTSDKASSSMAPKMTTASNSSIAPTVPLSSSSVQAKSQTISLPSSSNKAKSSIVPKMPTASNSNNAPTLPLSSTSYKTTSSIVPTLPLSSTFNKATSSIVPILPLSSTFDKTVSSNAPTLPLTSSSNKATSGANTSMPSTSGKATSSISPMAMLDHEIALFVSNSNGNLTLNKSRIAQTSTAQKSFETSFPATIEKAMESLTSQSGSSTLKSSGLASTNLPVVESSTKVSALPKTSSQKYTEERQVSESPSSQSVEMASTKSSSTLSSSTNPESSSPSEVSSKSVTNLPSPIDGKSFSSSLFQHPELRTNASDLAPVPPVDVDDAQSLRSQQNQTSANDKESEALKIPHVGNKSLEKIEFDKEKPLLPAQSVNTTNLT